MGWDRQVHGGRAAHDWTRPAIIVRGAMAWAEIPTLPTHNPFQQRHFRTEQGPSSPRLRTDTHDASTSGRMGGGGVQIDILRGWPGRLGIPDRPECRRFPEDSRGLGAAAGNKYRLARHSANVSAGPVPACLYFTRTAHQLLALALGNHDPRKGTATPTAPASTQQHLWLLPGSGRGRY